MHAFENLLKTCPWENVTNENRPKNAFTIFLDKINEAVDMSFPEVVK